MATPEASRTKMATDQKCGLRRGAWTGGAGVWPGGMRGGATAGPVGDLRKRFSSWLSSVDNRPSLLAHPFGDRVIAFSSEVGTGSRKENASKQESRASVLNRSSSPKLYTNLWPRIWRRCLRHRELF